MKEARLFVSLKVRQLGLNSCYRSEISNSRNDAYVFLHKRGYAVYICSVYMIVHKKAAYARNYAHPTFQIPYFSFLLLLFTVYNTYHVQHNKYAVI